MRFLLLVLLLTPRLARAQDAVSAAANVIVLANGADPGSVRVAEHYAEVRHVPRANVIALPMPPAETITWAEFVGQIWQPLQDELVRRKWIDAIPMALTDEVGRRKLAVAGHRISYLVVCRGVPLRIGHDPARYRPMPPVTDNPYFQTNQAAVDSELSLLAASNQPTSAFLANPLYANARPSTWQRSQVVKVSRLDGPTVDDACELADRAIAAERTGLLGRAYVDLGGIRPDGDRWLETTARELVTLGFEVDVDHSPATMPATARCDAPVLYFGWYAPTLNGPFALPGFRFPPGAIAVHVHSDTAQTLRADGIGWSGPLVARGVTATVGNVFEPYLQLLHRPDLLLAALARGETFGDAAYYALPALSWQSIAIGDPLYRPFAVSAKEQWTRRAELPWPLAAYATVGEARRLAASRHPAEARALLRETQRKSASLPVAVALAQALEKSGETIAGGPELEAATPGTTVRPDEWALAHELAVALLRLKAPALAVRWHAQVLDDPALPADLRRAWIGSAREAARAAGDAERLREWGGLDDGVAGEK